MRFHKNIFLFLGILFIGTTLSYTAQKATEFPFPVTQYRLKNGLQVILSEDYSLPLVSVVVAYKAGSFNEQEGKAGLAYLLENMMFQGSKNISQMQHVSFINKVGGALNATTTVDKTIFSQTVPSNQLALVLWLESDRMSSLEITESSIEQAKEALIEEIRQRKRTNPYGDSEIHFNEILYLDFPYVHPVFGIESDLREITTSDVKEFYSVYYKPNNAVLCVTGYIDKTKTIELIGKYFDSIPPGKEIPAPPLFQFQQSNGAVETFENSLASSPGFYLGYRFKSPYSEDFYAFKIIEYILLRGQSSRLYRKLVEKDRTALRLMGGIEVRRDLAAFKIFVSNNNPLMRSKSLNAIYSEISKLKSNFVSEKELSKAKNMLRRDYMERYTSTINKAIFLTETFILRNSIDYQADSLEKYLNVSASKIIGVMNKYFTQKHVILYIDIK